LRPFLERSLRQPDRPVEGIFQIDEASPGRWLRLKAIASAGPDGKIRGAAVLTDVSAQMRRLEKMRYDAEHDPLTGLPNRSRLLTELTRNLQELKRKEGAVGVLFIDLDNFKPVNDRHGHTLGDRLLRAVGERLRKRLAPGSLLTRYGGDEFVVLISGLPAAEREAEEEISAEAQKFLEHFRRPLFIEGSSHPISLSIGVAITRDPKTSAGELIRQADQAMYHAKQSGKNRIVCFREIPGSDPHRSSSPPAEDSSKRFDASAGR
jgi:diguanylate cyclase (GGDEF)-like protein